MATTVKNARYNESTVYGNLAYDYGKAAPYREGMGRPVDRQVVIPAPPRINEEVAVRTRVQTNQAVSPFALIGFVCAAILLVFTLMAKIQLTAVTNGTVTLENKLSDLKVTQNRLLINYEKAFNLTEIEEYATNNLGMQRPRDEQVFYLDSSVPDKAVVLTGKTAKSGFIERFFDAVSSISEYFK
jgi:Cell division protein FtsL.